MPGMEVISVSKSIISTSTVNCEKTLVNRFDGSTNKVLVSTPMLFLNLSQNKPLQTIFSNFSNWEAEYSVPKLAKGPQLSM